MGLDLVATARGRVAWSDLRARLALPQEFPVELPSGEVLVDVRVEVCPGIADGTRSPEIYPAEVANSDVVFWCVAEYRLPRNPQLFGLEIDRAIRFEFFAGFDSEGDLEQALSAELTGVARIGVRIRPPAPPQLDGVSLRFGDPQGWVGLALEVRAGTGGVALHATLRDLARIEVQFPGLPQPAPPLVLFLDKAEGELRFDADRDVTAALKTSGGFRLRTPRHLAGPPGAQYLEEILGGRDIGATIEGTLTIGPEPKLEVICLLGEFGFAVDLIGVLQRLAGGRATPEDGEADMASRSPVGIGLDRFELVIARSPSVALSFAFRAPGLDEPILLELGLSEQRASLALRDQAIPLWLPHILRKDFVHLDGQSHSDGPRVVELIRERVRSAKVAGFNEKADQLIAVIEATNQVIPPPELPDSFADFTALEQGDDWVCTPLKPPSDLRFRLGMGTRGDSRAPVFGVERDQQWTALLIQPSLWIKELELDISLRNPQDITVSGTVQMREFAGPLKPLNALELGVGISSDLIWAAARSTPPRDITIPPLLPGYGEGTVTFGLFKIGFGYAKRSFVFALEGGVKLPRELVDDLDASDRYGAGIRLPIQSAVRARLDVIPVPIGKVVIPVPIAQLDIDLRQASSPPIADAAICEPSWDGLQIHVPNVFRIGLKRFSYSPLLGMVASSNSDFDGDLRIGTASSGLTVVVDELFWAYGIDNLYSLASAPILAHPFVDNLCVQVQLGGFGLHFHVSRPLPKLSPFAIFEVAALANDPEEYEVDPDGDLAQTISVSLHDARITLPEPIRRLMPGVAEHLDRPVSAELDLATAIGLVQGVARAVQPIVAAGIEAWSAARPPAQIGRELLESASELRPESVVADLLAGLPPILRKARLELDFGGFSGSGALLFATRAEAGSHWGTGVFGGDELTGFAAADLDRIEPPASGAAPRAQDLRPAIAGALIAPAASHEVLSSHLLASIRPAALAVLQQLAGGAPWTEARARQLASALAETVRGPSLYTDDRFAGIQLADGVLASIAAGRPEAIARVNRLLLEAAYPEGFVPVQTVIVAARLRVCGADRLRFLGRLYEDGAFGLIARASLLTIPVFGLEPLPFRATGTLALSGRARRTGVSATIRATGSGSWAPIPGAVDVALKGALELQGDGRFLLAAQAKLTVLGGAGTGTLTATEAGARVDRAELSWELGPIAIRLGPGEGWIGPGPRFGIAGRGTLSLFGGVLAGAVAVDEGGVRARVDGDRVELPGIPGARLERVRLEGALRRPARAEVFDPQGSMLVPSGIPGAPPEGPRAWFSGSGQLVLLGGQLKIDGQLMLESDGGAPRIEARGALHWMERDWVGGSVMIDPKGNYEVGGRTSFTLELPDSPLGLALVVDISGTLNVDVAETLLGGRIQVRWTLGWRPPGIDGQRVPLLIEEQTVTVVDVGTFSDNARIAVPNFAIVGFPPMPQDALFVRSWLDEGNDPPSWRFNLTLFGTDVPIRPRRAVQKIVPSFFPKLQEGAFEAVLVWQDGRLAVQLTYDRSPVPNPILELR